MMFSPDIHIWIMNHFQTLRRNWTIHILHQYYFDYVALSLILPFPCHFSAGHGVVCNHWKATGNIIFLSIHVLRQRKQQQCKYSCLVLLQWWWFLCGCVCLQGSRLDEQRCEFPPPLRVGILAQNILFVYGTVSVYRKLGNHKECFFNFKHFYVPFLTYEGQGFHFLSILLFSPFPIQNNFKHNT